MTRSMISGWVSACALCPSGGGKVCQSEVPSSVRGGRQVGLGFPIPAARLRVESKATRSDLDQDQDTVRAWDATYAVQPGLAGWSLAWSAFRGQGGLLPASGLCISQGQGSADEWCGNLLDHVPRGRTKVARKRGSEAARRGSWEFDSLGRADASRLRWSQTWRIRRGWAGWAGWAEGIVDWSAISTTWALGPFDT